MNVNLTTATESTKLTKGSGDRAESQPVESESVGFFAQLAAMLKGESKSESTSESSAVNGDQKFTAVEGDTDAASAAVLLDDDLVDASEDTAKDSSVDAELQDGSQAQATAIPTALEGLVEQPDAKTAVKSSDQEVERTVAESEALLGRLDQANKTLQPKDGNSLPQKGATSGQTELNSADAATNGAPATIASDALSAPTQAPQSTIQISNAQGPLSVATEQKLSTSEQKLMLDANSQIQTAARPEEEQAVEAAMQAQTHAPVSVDSNKLALDNEGLKHGAKGINAQQLLASQSANQTLPQSSNPATNQAALQPAQLAGMPAAIAAQPNAMVPPMPIDSAAMQQLQQLQPAQLQAALAANGTALLGKTGKDNDSSLGIEASFAQQLSHAAGQSGINGLMRTEQTAQAQPSLPLNREMAGEQLAERVQMMLSKNLKNIDIRLDPPELGRMQIRMNMNGDNASVHFTVTNQHARDVIEQAMPRLREMLAQQGMQLNDSSVQQQASGQQQGRYASAEQGGSGHSNGNQHFAGEENLEPDVKLDLNVASKRDGISYYA